MLGEESTLIVYETKIVRCTVSINSYIRIYELIREDFGNVTQRRENISLGAEKMTSVRQVLFERVVTSDQQDP